MFLHLSIFKRVHVLESCLPVVFAASGQVAARLLWGADFTGNDLKCKKTLHFCLENFLSEVIHFKKAK